MIGFTKTRPVGRWPSTAWAALRSRVHPWLAVPLIAVVLAAAGCGGSTTGSNTEGTTSNGLPSFQPSHKASWYALGDSYISGEGTFVYAPVTDTGQDFCHRSSLSYAALLGVPTANFVACSGATVADLWTGSQGEAPQLDRVGRSATLVMLSVGGDSLGFSDVLKTCILLGSAACGPRIDLAESQIGSPEQINSNVASDSAQPGQPVEDQLLGVLKSLHERAPHAWIMLVGYPQIFPPNPSSSCSLIQPASQLDMNSAVVAVDSAWTRVTDTAVRAGIPVFYLSTESAFANGQLCAATADSSKAALVNGLTTTPVGVPGVSAGRTDCHVANGAGYVLPGGTQIGVCVDSFHPTQSGYAVLEKAVASGITNLCHRHCRSS